MNAIDVLTDDHHKARNIFIDFRKAHEAKDTAAMAEAVEKAFEELEIHTAIEERVFYPAVKKAGGSSLIETVDESNEEHHVVDVLMKEIRDLDPSDDAYAAKMTVLMENVEHHAGEEEKEMFPKVKELFSEDRLEELGEELRNEKLKVKVERKTTDELREWASQLEIDGRSELDAGQLRAAVLGALLGGRSD